jgi:hypothetical protein
VRFTAVILFWAILCCAYSQEIPAGFNVKRYASIWERNPFTLVKPAAPKVLASAFAKLNLTSWLIVGGKEVICVENSETRGVQTIALEPNQNNIRLISLRLNPNPRLVEAVISDGNELGTVKYRYDDRLTPVPTISPLAQAATGDPSIPAQNPAVAGSQAASRRSQSPGLQEPVPVNPPVPYRIYPGMPRVFHEGGGLQQSSETAAPRRKRVLQNPAAAH